jgi:hypothetical protein
MFNAKYLWLAGLLLLLGGCGSAEQAEPSRTAPEAPVEEEGVFDPMVGTMDRAKAVEGVGASRKEEMDKRLEQAE